MRKTENLVILIVEDDENDVLLLQRALRKSGVKSPIHVVRDGQEAIDYLLRKGPYEDREKFPYPDVIFTDLKLPRKNGFELLDWLRNNPVYQVIPILVLTSSRDLKDIRHAYYLGANGYLVKPSGVAELEAMMKVTWDFWCTCEIPQM